MSHSGIPQENGGGRGTAYATDDDPSDVLDGNIRVPTSDDGWEGME